MPDDAKPDREPEADRNHHEDKINKADVPAPDTRLPHAEATDKDYDELEALRRYVFTQR
jgi:hypothetical protein